MAVAFARAGAAKLFLFSREEETLATTRDLAGKVNLDCRIFTYSLNLGKANDANGKLDVLINNAGSLEEWKPINDSDPLEWWQTYEVNMRGVYLATKACLPIMLNQSDLGLKWMQQVPEALHQYMLDTPELSAAVCVYLTTSEADYLRGRYVSSNWDLVALQERKNEILEKNLFKLVLAV
ncbi:hypothetical protein WJX73_002026 [Symbiochloris irregularis]|uniref:Uncharacterized protein n=1 Tax=Symbiochloris irregularis TaxID=706552 RepID=A0AAW1PWA8_9CHLO